MTERAFPSSSPVAVSRHCAPVFHAHNHTGWDAGVRGAGVHAPGTTHARTHASEITTNETIHKLTKCATKTNIQFVIRFVQCNANGSVTYL